MASQRKRNNPVSVLAHEMIDLSHEVFAEQLRSVRWRRGGLSRLEFLVLNELAERGPMSVKDVRGKLGLVAPQMTRIINRLQSNRKKPLVKRDLGIRDRRLTIVSVTPAGKSLMRKHLTRRVNRGKEALKSLATRDVVGALKFIRLMRETFEKLRGTPDEL